MTGREERFANDVFYACGLVEYIGRKTRNRRSEVAGRLGTERIARLVDLADVYHCENLDEVADGLIADCGIEPGSFDNVAAARYAVPSHWDIGKVYKRLALGILAHRGTADPTPAEAADAVLEAFCSPAAEKIDDYNGSFFYEAPANILAAHLYEAWE